VAGELIKLVFMGFSYTILMRGMRAGMGSGLWLSQVAGLIILPLVSISEFLRFFPRTYRLSAPFKCGAVVQFAICKLQTYANMTHHMVEHMVVLGDDNDTAHDFRIPPFLCVVSLPQ
jgi:hypothetical protein